MLAVSLPFFIDKKVHARCTGPYVATTQQPVGGRSHGGGQRLGEMEVWAFMAWGAVYNLRELLTIKSDNLVGRSTAYTALARGHDVQLKNAAVPEAFKVLLSELQALCLDISRYKILTETKSG